LHGHRGKKNNEAASCVLLIRAIDELLRRI
jgi:hypothetical protein